MIEVNMNLGPSEDPKKILNAVGTALATAFGSVGAKPLKYEPLFVHGESDMQRNSRAARLLIGSKALFERCSN